MARILGFFVCFVHNRLAIRMWVSAFFVKLLYCYGLDKHCLMLAFPVFQVCLFPEVVVIIHLYLHNCEWISLLRTHTLNICLYDIIWEGVLQACSCQFEKALFGIVLHLASARFI